MLPSGGQESEETGCILIERHTEVESDTLVPIQLPKDISRLHYRKIKRGTLFVHIQGAIVTNNEIVASDSAQFTVVDPPAGLRHLSEMEPAIGNKTIAIVRVSTKDSSPPASLDELRKAIVGNGISMKTQYFRCSMGQLQWIFAGGYDVKLNKHRISEFNSGIELLDAANERLNKELGITSAATLANKVIYCLAPGISGWIASAGVNHYRVNINGDWCLSLSVAMHEVGHTLGL